jgi:hypothetical protein
MFIDYSLYFNDMVLGFFVGVGGAIANFVINRSLIRRIDNLENKKNKYLYWCLM